MDSFDLDPRRLVCSIYRLWLVLGALATLALPAARGSDPLLGSGPLWLVGLPAACLFVGGVLRREAQSVSPSRLRSIRRRNSSMIRR